MYGISSWYDTTAGRLRQAVFSPEIVAIEGVGGSQPVRIVSKRC